MTDNTKQERKAFEALQKDAGIPYLPTKETYDFRMAVNGEGRLAYQWADKPHRLVDDACRIIEREAALRQPHTDAIKIAREALAFYAEGHPQPSEGPWGAFSTDFGTVARNALAALKETT